MDSNGTELHEAQALSLQHKIEEGRILGLEMLGDLELTERECLIVRRVFTVTYKTAVESTTGTDFSNREKTIIDAVSQEMVRRFNNSETM